MNEWLNRLILQAKIRTIGWYRWKKILSANGVVKAGALSEKQLDEIILKIFKSFFKESKKDKPIKLEKLGKTYENGYKAVHNFSLDVEPGDFVCLLGPSGCGKTTALRMIAGLDNITEGKYFLGNKEMNSIHPSERKTAMVFQNYALYPFMTVYNNIAFGLKLKITKNDLVSYYIKQILIDKYPNYEKIQDAKFALWEAKHPFHYEINAAKTKVKKASFKEFDKDELDSAKRELKKFEDLAAKQKNNIEGFVEIKHTIKKLKKEQKKLISQQKIELQKQEKIIKDQISVLLQKQREYKIKKQEMIPVINNTISKLEEEKNELTRKYNAEFK
ncbi:ATP-binding cassette domain-containing protein, partial [Mycoplasma marinum]